MSKHKEMKESTKTILIVLGIIAAVVLMTVVFVAGNYNSLVSTDEEVSRSWANVQSAYQRRADLIPNLVATVQQYSDYEGEVLTQITNARSKVGSASNPSELQTAGDEMNSAISRLLVVMENYPNLKANENYLSLQDQLEGTENRIKTERDVFNGAIKNYNIKVRRFPSNMIAGIFGFEAKDGFVATAGSENAPDVKALFD